jgi:heme exporter protein D
MAGYIWAAFGITIIGAGIWLFYTLRRVGKIEEQRDSLKDLAAAQKRQQEAVANAPKGNDLPDALRKGKAL